ncbi:MAG: DUF4194 domain-containing protein [Propionibacteriaceae bacterium]|nr:DUF4194 domain-containing protein [Propionibacteriaceae bacterium]
MTIQPAPRRAAEQVDDFDDDIREPIVDHGELSSATRRVLLALIRGPYLRSVGGDGRLWAALVRDEAQVRARLADLYLDLVLDAEAGLAFVRNLEVEDAPKVVRNHPLTLLDTALLLFLRRRLLAQQGSEVRTFVGRDEIEDQLRSYRPAELADKKGFDDRIGAAINKMKKNSVLLSTDDEERWEVSPVLGLVFGADEVAAVTRELDRLVAS